MIQLNTNRGTEINQVYCKIDFIKAFMFGTYKYTVKIALCFEIILPFYTVSAAAVSFSGWSRDPLFAVSISADGVTRYLASKQR